MDQEKIKTNLLSANQWTRILYMAAFALAAWVVLLVLCVIVFVQTAIVLITSRINDKLQDAGRLFAAYFFELLNFLVYATEEKPWPFAPFPGTEEQSHATEEPDNASEQNQEQDYPVLNEPAEDNSSDSDQGNQPPGLS